MRPVEQKHLCNEKALCKKLRATAKSVTQKKNSNDGVYLTLMFQISKKKIREEKKVKSF